MAKKDNLHMRGLTVPTFNLDSAVGTSGENTWSDVLLIQTIFRYVGMNEAIARRLLGLPMAELPQISGVFDGKTERAIWAFQRRNSANLLRVDGIIHPASYHDRVIKNMMRPVMVLSLMHNLVFDTAVARGDNDVIPGLVKMEPRLAKFLA